MAEFIMKDLVKKKGQEKDFYIESAATSTEELGNPVHRGTRAILDRLNIDYSKKRARQIIKADYDNFDYIVGMDEMNRRDMTRFFGGDPENKISLLLDYTDNPRDVADPWWTHNFEITYADVARGTQGLYNKIKK
jgi:protein-tyrosine phosphatase